MFPSYLSRLFFQVKFQIEKQWIINFCRTCIIRDSVWKSQVPRFLSSFSKFRFQVRFPSSEVFKFGYWCFKDRKVMFPSSESDVSKLNLTFKCSKSLAITHSLWAYLYYQRNFQLRERMKFPSYDMFPSSILLGKYGDWSTFSVLVLSENLYGNPMTGLPSNRKSSNSGKFISNDIKKRKSETISEMLPSRFSSYYLTLLWSDLETVGWIEQPNTRILL